MSSRNNSPILTSGSYGQKPATWGRTSIEPIINDPSYNVGSGMLLSVSDSIIYSPQYSYPSPVFSIPPALNHNYYAISSTGVFHNGLPSSSLGLPNGDQKPYYNEEINNVDLSGGDNCNHFVYGYQGCHHEQWSNSYQGSSSYMIPYIPIPREQPRPYMIPASSPPVYLMNVSSIVPSNLYNTYGVLNAIPYYHLNANNNSVHPQYQHCYVTSFYDPYQVFYASQQSNFSLLLANLREKLRKQIEYYFSSENLPTDYYLKKHMDGQVWVPITLLAQFRRVQQLMNERQELYDSFRVWNFMEVKVRPLADTIQFILDSLRLSSEVEVQGDKVRKRHDCEKWASHT